MIITAVMYLSMFSHFVPYPLITLSYSRLVAHTLSFTLSASFIPFLLTCHAGAVLVPGSSLPCRGSFFGVFQMSGVTVLVCCEFFSYFYFIIVSVLVLVLPRPHSPILSPLPLLPSSSCYHPSCCSCTVSCCLVVPCHFCLCCAAIPILGCCCVVSCRAVPLSLSCHTLDLDLAHALIYVPALALTPSSLPLPVLALTLSLPHVLFLPLLLTYVLVLAVT